MALLILNNTGNPLGQFDGYDAEYTTFLGGEVCKLVAAGLSLNDKAAQDIDDGYSGNSLKTRPAVSKVMAGGATEGPLFLADDGTANYGTLFGTVVGGIGGQLVSGGTVLGPHTATGSGKVTLWANPGIYGVTLDALDTAANGLVPANSALAVGTSVSYTTGGKLTPEGAGSNKAASARTVGHFVEFTTGDTLVTTPKQQTLLYTAPNTLAFKYAVISWLGGSL